MSSEDLGAQYAAGCFAVSDREDSRPGKAGAFRHDGLIHRLRRFPQIQKAGHKSDGLAGHRAADLKRPRPPAWVCLTLHHGASAIRGELIWSFVAGAPDCIAPLGLSPFAA